MKPNLFIVGAMKSGTSTMHDLLSAHPEVFMSNPKEPSYFLERSQLRKLWPQMARQAISYSETAYLDLFKESGTCRIVGESSTSYTKLPFSHGVVDRLRLFNAEARYIYVMRDPVERAISHYWHAVKMGAETRPPLDAFQSNDHYLAVSMYARQLHPFVETFGTTDVFPLVLERFNHHPEETFKALLTWLDVGSRHLPEDLQHRSHETPQIVEQQRPMGLVDHIDWNGIAQSSTGRLVPKALRTAMRKAIKKPVERAEVNMSGAREYLRQHLEQEVHQLKSLTSMSFPEWENFR